MTALIFSPWTWNIWEPHRSCSAHTWVSWRVCLMFLFLILAANCFLSLALTDESPRSSVVFWPTKEMHIDFLSQWSNPTTLIYSGCASLRHLRKWNRNNKVILIFICYIIVSLFTVTLAVHFLYDIYFLFEQDETKILVCKISVSGFEFKLRRKQHELISHI